MKSYINKILSKAVLFTVLALGLVSCSLDIDPRDELPKLTSVSDAKAALNAAYRSLGDRSYYGTDMITYGDLRGEDMASTKVGDRGDGAFVFANKSPLNYSNVGHFWKQMYNSLNRVNEVLPLLEQNAIDTESQSEVEVLKDIQGQLYALRAQIVFDLVRIHGIPYVIDKSKWGVVLKDKITPAMEKPKRATVEDTYKFILSDLEKSKALLVVPGNPNYMRFNYWSMRALYAKVCLTMGNNEDAYKYAKEVIGSSSYSLIPNDKYVNSWFEESTSESLFEINSTETANADREGIGYVMKPRNSTDGNKGYGSMIVSDQFLTLLKEDPNDVRFGLLSKSDTGTDSYLVKYPGRKGNLFVNNARVIRLSEMYLIVAEAGWKTGKADAVNYLNDIRKRANPLAVTLSTADLSFDVIEKERRKELVGEGHRAFDILRTLKERPGQKVIRNSHSGYPLRPTEINVIELGAKTSFRLIMPIPQDEINANPSIQQNDGY